MNEHDELFALIRRAGDVPPPPGRAVAMTRALAAAPRGVPRLRRFASAAALAALLAAPGSVIAIGVLGDGDAEDPSLVESLTPTPSPSDTDEPTATPTPSASPSPSPTPESSPSAEGTDDDRGRNRGPGGSDDEPDDDEPDEPDDDEPDEPDDEPDDERSGSNSGQG